jgi:hypothetical protein
VVGRRNSTVLSECVLNSVVFEYEGDTSQCRFIGGKEGDRAAFRLRITWNRGADSGSSRWSTVVRLEAATTVLAGAR